MFLLYDELAIRVQQQQNGIRKTNTEHSLQASPNQVIAVHVSLTTGRSIQAFPLLFAQQSRSSAQVNGRAIGLQLLKL